MKKASEMIALIISTMIIVMNAIIVIPVHAENIELTKEQNNAMAMMNFITVLTQEINASKNSRMYMEEAYSKLIDNTNPNAVDSRTLNQMDGLLDTMEKYRMLDVKRERLQYIYEQNKAQAIRAAIPNPLGLLSEVQSFSLPKLALSFVYMAVDSVTSYQSYKNQAEMQYLQDGWALDDEEASYLHESRKDAFTYMVKMVNDYSLPGDFALTEGSVAEFVTWKNNSNNVSRIQFLEANKNIYQSYGGYWLVLAESYYENSDYDKCLDAIETYENMDVKIFRRNYEFANILPLAISAAKEFLGSDDYVDYAVRHADMIVSNTDNDDWALRYFAAQAYIDAAGVSENKEYLEDAYEIIVNVVNYLVRTQHSMNEAFLNQVTEITVPKDAKKDEKKEINDYNKMLKEIRKKETAPVYEPMQLSCDLLFALANEIGISEAEETRIDHILHPNGAQLFLTKPVDDLYWFDKSHVQEQKPEIEFMGNIIIVPAAFLTEDSTIRVVVSETEFDDWSMNEVRRGTEGDPATFEASFSSSKASEFLWKPDKTAVITLTPNGGSDIEYKYFYNTVGTKNNWYDYLKVWEGHKNNWYDYAKVWENSVTFEYVRIR